MMFTDKVFATSATVALLMAMLAMPVAAQTNDSLYRDLGGKEKIELFTNDFVDILLQDPRIKDFFKDTNIPRLKMLLAEQFISLAGGPVKYSGADMKSVHTGLNIRNADFNALAEDLQIAMDRAKVPFFTQNRLIALLAPMQRDIVTK